MTTWGVLTFSNSTGIAEVFGNGQIATNHLNQSGCLTGPDSRTPLKGGSPVRPGSG